VKSSTQPQPANDIAEAQARAHQARADDARNTLAAVALRARGFSDETWENAADVLDALTLALSEGDAGTLAKMAELARKAERVRDEAFGTKHRGELITDFQQWDGSNPTAEAMAGRFVDRAQNLALSLGARGKPDESYLPEEVIRRVATALDLTFSELRNARDQKRAKRWENRGKSLVAAGLRALGTDWKAASNALDQRPRRARPSTDR